jgi:putative nucleotidyltransferase with HDIG domain
VVDARIAASPRSGWLGRGVAGGAAAIGVGLAYFGVPEAAIATAAVGLAALCAAPRTVTVTRVHALELVREVAARASAAERLEGGVVAALEAVVDGGHAQGAVALIRRGEGGFCDAYFRADRQLVREELLWQPELDAPSDDGPATPRLPPRLGRPRGWIARPIVGRGEVCGSLVALEPSGAARGWLGPALAVIGAQLGALVLGERFSDRLEHGYVATIEALIGALEAKDPYTAGHSSRVATYAVAIASELGLEDGIVEELQTGAILHDIGKIGVGDGVLFKPGRLSDAEFAEIKDHPRRGARIIDAFNRSSTVLGVVFHHHERYDGRGYPAGLRGVDIPLCARIVNVADAYDAMTTNRPYQSSKTRAEALGELRRGSGSQFDPDVVAALESAFARGVI